MPPPLDKAMLGSCEGETLISISNSCKFTL